jgi:hypothetical protein
VDTPCYLVDANILLDIGARVNRKSADRATIVIAADAGRLPELVMGRFAKP